MKVSQSKENCNAKKLQCEFHLRVFLVSIKFCPLRRPKTFALNSSVLNLSSLTRLTFRLIAPYFEVLGNDFVELVTTFVFYGTTGQIDNSRQFLSQWMI